MNNMPTFTIGIFNNQWNLSNETPCNYSLRTLPELPLLPLFYRDVLSTWENISKHTARTKNEIGNEILWNNHEVTIGGKSVFYKQWYDAGVKTLPDILDKEGKFVYSIQGEVQN